MIYKMRYKINLIVSLMLFSIIAYSQEQITISGIIREKSTKEILSNATIQIAENVGLSNDRGHFAIVTLKGEQELTVSYVGFKKYRRNIDFQKDTALTIELDEGVLLSDVVVLQKQPALRNSGLGNMQLDVAQLRKMPLFLGERDIIKGMQFLPGVSSGMEGSSNLNVRGGTNDQTLYQMDDVPVYNQNHTFGLLSVFNSDVLRTANLYKGGIPAAYGNRLSGVAAISLKDGNQKEHHQTLSIGMLSGNLLLEGPILNDRLSYMVAIRKSTLDLLEKTAVAVGNSANGLTVFSFHDINAKLSWDIDKKTNLSLQFNNGSDDMYAQNKSGGYDEKFGYGWNTKMASLRLTSSLRQNLFLSINVYYTHLKNSQYYQYKYKSRDINRKNDIYSDLNEAGVKAKFEHKVSNRNTMFYGIEATRQKFDPNFVKRMLNKKNVVYETKRLWMNSLAVFLYDEFNYNDWSFTAGLRASLYNNETQSVVVVEPRVKINRILDSKNKVMLAYDYTTQPLHSVNEMNYTTTSDFWIPFQEDELPHAQQISIGWKNYSIQHLTLSVEGYWKEMKNLLRIDNLENYLDYHESFYTGKGRSYGLEFMTQYDYERFSAWLSYTLSKSTRTFDGVTYPFKYDSPNDVSAFVSYDVHKTKERRNTLSMNAQYHTGIPYYVSSVEYPSVGMPSYKSGYPFYDISKVGYIPRYPNTRLSNYFRMDINFTMEKQLKKGGSRIWQFSFLNLTGHKNPYAVYQNEAGKYKAFLLIPFLPSFSYTRCF